MNSTEDHTEAALGSVRIRFGKIFLWAALFRLLFLVWSWTPWLAEEQSGMSSYYFRQGYGLAAGYGYIGSEGEGSHQLKVLDALVEQQGLHASAETAPPLPKTDIHPEMLHPPGMAIMIAGFHRLLGIPADLPMQMAGLLMDSAAAVLLCWLVAQALSPQIGSAVGWVYAFFPPVAYGAASSRTPEGMMGIFIIGATTCVWMAMFRGKNRWLLWSVSAGLVLGLGTYFRPDYLLLPVALGAGAWAMSRQFWFSMRNLVLVQLITLAVMLPWAWRNHELSGRWIFTSTSTGATLVTGLGEFKNPWGLGGADADRGTEAAAQGFGSPWSAGADAYFRGFFWRSVKEHPLGYVKTIVKRIPFALAPPLDFGLQNPFKTKSFNDLRGQEGEDRYAVVKSQFGHTLLSYADVLAMSGVCLFALVADLFMFWRERRRWGLCFFLFSPHLYALGTHLLTHFEPRFLLPSIGFLLIGYGYLVSLRGGRKGGSKASTSAPRVSDI